MCGALTPAGFNDQLLLGAALLLVGGLLAALIILWPEGPR